MELIVTHLKQGWGRIQIIGQFWQREECAQFKNTVKQCLDEGLKNIVVDLSRLTYTSSQGLGTLVTAFSVVSKQKGSFSIMQPRGIVKDLIELSGFNAIMQIVDSEREIKNYDGCPDTADTLEQRHTPNMT